MLYFGSVCYIINRRIILNFQPLTRGDCSKFKETSVRVFYIVFSLHEMNKATIFLFLLSMTLGQIKPSHACIIVKTPGRNKSVE